jgi:hypothetical protein
MNNQDYDYEQIVKNKLSFRYFSEFIAELDIFSKVNLKTIFIL